MPTESRATPSTQQRGDYGGQAQMVVYDPMAMSKVYFLPTDHNPTPPAQVTLPFWGALVSGAAAGISVDVTMFPIDTLKTRLQSSQGFMKAGGFSKIYSGLRITTVASAPTAAIFFGIYESLKKLTLAEGKKTSTFAVATSSCSAAAVAELGACLVRVPTENIKQKMQANMFNSTQVAITSVYKTQGVGGFFRGFGTTVARDAPFAFIQFPFYESFKLGLSRWTGSELSPWQSAACGSLGSVVAGAATCPLDVVKTRLMLGADKDGVPYRSMLDVFKRLHAEGGIKVLFSGLGPRIGFLSVGGLVFFGSYEFVKGQVLKTQDN